jgi:hypothetical protein
MDSSRQNVKTQGNDPIVEGRFFSIEEFAISEDRAFLSKQFT